MSPKGRPLALVLLLALTVCRASVPSSDPGPNARWFRAPEWNAGPEPYSAWFGDAAGGVLYFGLSPFWTLWWDSGGDPLLDLEQPGDHLIGRFDLRARRFLPPLRVRAAGSGARSSVWDVLVHSSGRVWYTTFFEEMGSVSPDGGDVRHFAGAGPGLNELAEGLDGRVWATRYSDAPGEPERQTHGSVVAFGPDGRIEREIRFPREGDVFTAPKSIAVDPTNGEIWVNTDTFEGSRLYHDTLRLAADGALISRTRDGPELHFVSFDAHGRGWFAEDADGDLRVRLTSAGTTADIFSLGRRRPADFVQDIKFSGELALVTLWSRRVFVLYAEEGERLNGVEVELRAPTDCVDPVGRSLAYTAVAYADSVFATLFCGRTILRAPLSSALERRGLDERVP